jgi:preprotein translocase subunit SecG
VFVCVCVCVCTTVLLHDGGNVMSVCVFVCVCVCVCTTVLLHDGGKAWYTDHYTLITIHYTESLHLLVCYCF